jgi:uncharacterized membrane protein
MSQSEGFQMGFLEFLFQPWMITAEVFVVLTAFIVVVFSRVRRKKVH